MGTPKDSNLIIPGIGVLIFGIGVGCFIYASRGAQSRLAHLDGFARARRVRVAKVAEVAERIVEVISERVGNG